MEIESDPSERKAAKNRVRVGIRVRPMISRELLSHERTCVDYPSKGEIVIGGDRQYKFDRVFREGSTQEEVYDESVRELILGCFEGYNAAVLAYGQTGSTPLAIQAARPSPWAPTPPPWTATRRA
jgi:hypothetical protein